MVDVMRKLRWGRAWVAAALVCAAMGWPGAASAQNDSTGAGGQAPTATAPGANQTATPSTATVATPTQDAAQDQDSTANSDSSAAASAGNSAQPVAKNLETGAPLRVVMSPLHWGHLSLLSFEGFEVYDSNYQRQQAIAGRQLTAIQGLVVYSIQKAKSEVDLQYCPYVWFSPNQTYKNFTANALDFTTSHVFSRRWSVTANDNFQYSPNLANTLQSAFSADYIGNTVSQTAFLSAGRKALFNNVDLGINTQLSQSSRLTFNLLDDYVRLGSYEGSVSTSLPLPIETMNSYGGGVNLSQQLNSRTTVTLAYNYRRQRIFGVGADSTYNTADVGLSRVLKRGLNLTLEAGPGWSNSAGATSSAPARKQTTVQGSAELFKALRNGGVALSFYRGTEFSGIVSNSYNNRYDIAFNRRLFTRWNFMISGSYVQQEFVGKPLNTGELGSAQLGYMLSRNWSVFSGYRYLNMGGNNLWSGPQQLVSFGIRWAWQPEMARK